MTEPNGDDGRVPGVHDPAAALRAVPGEPELAVAPVYDLESRLELRLTGEAARAEFHDFYTASRDRVGRALALTLGNDDLASDSVDEAMVRAYQRWGKVAALDNPAGWVYRVAVNVARSRIRRVARRITFGTVVATPEATREVHPGDPSIVAALAELSVDHRSVVVCRLFLDWSEADTAAALGIRPGTVKSRLSRALAQLETRLAHLRPGVTNQPHPDEERS